MAHRKMIGMDADATRMTVVYCGDMLAPVNHERLPKLCVWTDCLPGFYVEQDVVWRENSAEEDSWISFPIVFEIPRITEVSRDSSIYISAMALRRTEDEAEYYAEEGATRMRLCDIEGREPVRVSFVMYSDRDNLGEPFEKGSAVVSFEGGLAEAAAIPSPPRDISERLAAATSALTQRYWGFYRRLRESDLSLRGVHVVVYNSVGLGALPGYAFYLEGEGDDRYADEAFLSGLFEIALRRRGISDVDFVRFGDAGGLSLIDAATVTGEAIALLAAALPYATDVVDETRRKGGYGKSAFFDLSATEKVIDTYGWPPRSFGADCEDFLRLMLALYRWVVRGAAPDGRAWGSSVIEAARRICSQYCFLPSLGSASNAKAGDGVTVGAEQSHLFAVMIPKKKMSRFSVELPPYDAESWGGDLPTLLLEGTGMVMPRLLSAVTYAGPGSELVRRAQDEELYADAAEPLMELGLLYPETAGAYTDNFDFYKRLAMSYVMEVGEAGGAFEHVWQESPGTWGARTGLVLRDEPSGVRLTPVRIPLEDEAECVREALRHEIPRFCPKPFWEKAPFFKKRPRKAVGSFLPPFSKIHFNTDELVECLKPLLTVLTAKCPASSIEETEKLAKICGEQMFSVYCTAACDLTIPENRRSFAEAAAKTAKTASASYVCIITEKIADFCVNFRLAFCKEKQ